MANASALDTGRMIGPFTKPLILRSSTRGLARCHESDPIAIAPWDRIVLPSYHAMQSGHPQTPRLPQLRVRFQPTAQQDTSSDSSGDETESKAADTSADGARKKPRYLSDVDRSVIIQRLEAGVKQADLAREFGVTRAAISHINKHKDTMLTRFDTFARSPHGRVMIENYTRSSTEFDSVIEVRTAPASILVTRIKDRETPPAIFYASARRLMRLLLEEALLVCASTYPAVATGAIVSTDLGEFEAPTGIALGHEGLLVLGVFKEMEPEAANGTISAMESNVDPELGSWQVLRVDVPDVESSKVFILAPVLSTCDLIFVAIEELLVRGVAPSAITVVSVFCSDEAVRAMHLRHPDLRAVSASVEKSGDNHGVLNNFVPMYKSSQQVSTLL